MMTNADIRRRLSEILDTDISSLLWSLEELGLIGPGEYYEPHEINYVLSQANPTVLRSVYINAAY